MKTYVYQIAVIVWKDTLLEVRTREVVISMIVAGKMQKFIMRDQYAEELSVF